MAGDVGVLHGGPCENMKDLEMGMELWSSGLVAVRRAGQ